MDMWVIKNFAPTQKRKSFLKVTFGRFEIRKKKSFQNKGSNLPKHMCLKCFKNDIVSYFTSVVSPGSSIKKKKTKKSSQELASVLQPKSTTTFVLRTHLTRAICLRVLRLAQAPFHARRWRSCAVTPLRSPTWPPQ